MEDHNYYITNSAKKIDNESKRRKYEEEKRARDKKRHKTRVNIAVAFSRWRFLMMEKSLRTDSEVACFLLDSYERSLTSTPPRATTPPRSSIDAASQTDRDEPLDKEPEGTDGQGVKKRRHDVGAVKEQMDETVINNPFNSVIDWADEGSPSLHQKDGEKEDSSDEEYFPPICIRMGGAPSPNQLPVIGIDETVHDWPARDPLDGPPPSDQEPVFAGPQKVLYEDDVIDAKASILYEHCLRQLVMFLNLPVDKCIGLMTNGVECGSAAPFETNISSRGTAMTVEWVCPNRHIVWRWNSQPIMNFGMQAGDFMLSTNILLSGNNYTNMGLLFKFMNMGMVSQDTFLTIQDAYCVDTIKDFWEEKRTEAIGRLQGKDVVVLADGRNYSPGHCAEYCSYIAMENDSKEIIHVATIDKQQTSVAMEKEAFIQTVDRLTSEIKLVEICTDAHAQIGTLMHPEKGRYKALGIHHSLDMWHGAMNLAQKIVAASKKNGQSVLLHWLKDIVNHFWWCCKTAETTEKFLALWVGILHHVCNVHTWAMGRCQHGHLEQGHGKEWIQRDSECHKVLVDIILNKCWQKDVHKYLRFRSTADLEAFQNHILMYASERYRFTPPVYEARVLLAALDYNFHHNRPTVTTAEGRQTLSRVYNKKARRYSVHALKSEKTYGYISELQARILNRRLTSGAGMPQKKSLQPGDSRWLILVPSVTAVPVAGLVQTQDKKGLET